jgi:hypothetical protein
MLLQTFSGIPPGFTLIFSDCGEKLANLRLRRNPPGAPLPQPILAGILRLDKRDFFAVSRAV